MTKRNCNCSYPGLTHASKNGHARSDVPLNKPSMDLWMASTLVHSAQPLSWLYIQKARLHSPKVLLAGESYCFKQTEWLNWHPTGIYRSVSTTVISLCFRQALNEALNRQFGVTYLLGDSSDDARKSRIVRLNCRTMETETLSEVPLIDHCRILRNKGKRKVIRTCS